MKKLFGSVRSRLAVVSAVALIGSGMAATMAVATPSIVAGSLSTDLGGFSSTDTPQTQHNVVISAPSVNAGTYTETLSASGFGSVANFGSAAATKGFTLYYQDQNGNWTTTVPLNVVAVKAVGNLTSAGGSSSVQQVLSGTSTFAPNLSSFKMGVGGHGDGWDVSFDSGYTRLYNVYHHGSPSMVDCHMIYDGTRCPGFPVRLSFIATNHRPHALVTSNGDVYVAGNYGTKAGFECVTAAGASCGWKQVINTITTPNGTYNNFVGASQVVNNKIFGVDVGSGRIGCWDLAYHSICTGQPAAGYTIGLGAGTYQNAGNGFGEPWNFEQLQVGNYLFVTGPNSTGFGSGNGQISCLDLTTMAKCAGSGSTTWPRPATGFSMIAPATNGSPYVCTIMATAKCYNMNATNATTPTGLTAALNVMSAGGPVDSTHNGGNGNVTTPDGVKYYWSRGTWYNGTNAATDPVLMCWNASTGTTCPNFPIVAQKFLDAGAAVGTAYTVTADPVIANCVWTNSDTADVFKWNTSTGAFGCPPPPAGTGPNPNFTFTASAPKLVPSQNCSGSDGTTGFSTLTINSDTGSSTGYRVTVVNGSTGLPVTGFTNLTVPTVSGVPTLDLSGLTIAAAGTNPSFRVTALGFGYSGSIVLGLSKIVNTPQLCVTLTSKLVMCPSFSAMMSGTVPNSNPTATLTESFTATSTTDSSQTQTVSTTDTIGVVNSNVTLAKCEGIPKDPTWSNIVDTADGIKYDITQPTYTGGAPYSDMTYYQTAYYLPWRGTVWQQDNEVQIYPGHAILNTFKGQPLQGGSYCVDMHSRNSAGESFSRTFNANNGATFCIDHSILPVSPNVTKINGFVPRNSTTGLFNINYTTNYTGLKVTYTVTLLQGGVTLTTGTSTTPGTIVFSGVTGVTGVVTAQVQACNALGCVTGNVSANAKMG